MKLTFLNGLKKLNYTQKVILSFIGLALSSSLLLSNSADKQRAENAKKMAPSDQTLKNIEHFKINELLTTSIDSTRNDDKSINLEKAIKYYDSIADQYDDMKSYQEAMIEIGKNGQPYRPNEINFSEKTYKIQ